MFQRQQCVDEVYYERYAREGLKLSGKELQRETHALVRLALDVKMAILPEEEWGGRRYIFPVGMLETSLAGVGELH